MTQFQYEVNVYEEDRVLSCKTNNPRTACQFMLDHADCYLDVINGFTGEVLAVMNYENAYCQEDFGLMLLGYMTETIWG